MVIFAMALAYCCTVTKYWPVFLHQFLCTRRDCFHGSYGIEKS